MEDIVNFAQILQKCHKTCSSHWQYFIGKLTFFDTRKVLAYVSSRQNDCDLNSFHCVYINLNMYIQTLEWSMD